MFKKIKRKPQFFSMLIICLCFVSMFIFYDLMKKENFVIKKVENIEDVVSLTVKSNKILNPTARKILVIVNESTTIIDSDGNEPVLEKGTKVLIEYNMMALSNPPITKPTKITTLSSK